MFEIFIVLTEKLYITYKYFRLFYNYSYFHFKAKDNNNNNKPYYPICLDSFVDFHPPLSSI